MIQQNQMQFVAYQNNNADEGCAGINGCPYKIFTDHMSRSYTEQKELYTAQP